MATKSKGVGRGFGSGGPRPGAGRKPSVESLRIAKKKLAPVVQPTVKKEPKPKPAAAGKAKAAPKPKASAPEAKLPAPLAAAIKEACEQPSLLDMPEPSLEDLEGIAKRALKQVLECSPKDAPRVSAAKLVKEWAQEQRAADTEAKGLTGKKAQAQAAAEGMVDDDDWGADISVSLSEGRMLN